MEFKLGMWLENQRKEYRMGILDSFKKEALQQIVDQGKLSWDSFHLLNKCDNVINDKSESDVSHTTTSSSSSSSSSSLSSSSTSSSSLEESNDQNISTGNSTNETSSVWNTLSTDLLQSQWLHEFEALVSE